MILCSLLEFQQTEGTRQQEQWASQKNFTDSVNSHIVTVQDTLASMKTAGALNSEKITMALNNAEKAGNTVKNMIKKMGIVNTLQNDVSALKTSQVRGLLKCQSVNR